MASDRLWQDRNEKRVILDSSAILMLFEFSINLEDELTNLLGKFKIILPSPIVEELKFLSNFGNGKKGQNAKAALELLKRYEIVDEEGNGDDSIINLAKKINGIVVTNDRDLKRRIKELSLKVIYLRGKKKLVLE
jgi:rRNA-processing protein FCF1